MCETHILCIVALHGNMDCLRLCHLTSGQAGVFTASSGLQIAYLSGRHGEHSYTSTTTGLVSLELFYGEKFEGFVNCSLRTYMWYLSTLYCYKFLSQSENFSQSDVERLMSLTEKKDYVGVDILLSSDWPSDVAIGANPPVSNITFEL